MRGKTVRCPFADPHHLGHARHLRLQPRKIIAHHHRQDNGIGQPVLGVIFGAHHMRDGVHHAQPLEKGDAGHAGPDKHPAPRHHVSGLAHRHRKPVRDQRQPLQRHRVAKRMKPRYDIGLDGVGHRIGAGPGCQMRRQSDRQLRIEKRQRRLQPGVANTEFHALAGMGDHRRAFRLGTGSRRRRNGHEMRERLVRPDLRRRRLPLEIPQIDLVAGCQADRLAAIHGTAAPDGDDGIMPPGQECGPARRNFRVPGVRRDIREQPRFHAGGGENRHQARDKWQSRAAAVRHHKRRANAKPRTLHADFGKPSRAIGDGDRKAPVLRLQHRGVIIRVGHGTSRQMNGLSGRWFSRRHRFDERRQIRAAGP